MMKKTQKIGWQKYEDVLESRIQSPLMAQLYQSLSNMIIPDAEPGVTEDIDLAFDGEHEKLVDEPVVVGVDPEFSSEIALASNFDCWVGHTNFNLTEEIKTALNTIDGIEVLKICSRYRFFIGVGKMFDFAEVRQNIETKITLN
jgi:hypothetical protein